MLAKLAEALQLLFVSAGLLRLASCDDDSIPGSPSVASQPVTSTNPGTGGPAGAVPCVYFPQRQGPSSVQVRRKTDMGTSVQDAQGQLQGYGGWLAFFCFCVIYANPVVWVLSLFLAIVANTSGYPNLWWVEAISLAGGLIIAVLGITAGRHLKAGARSALRLTRFLLILAILWAAAQVVIAAAAFGGLPINSVNEQLFSFVLTAVVCGAWLIYFARSKRVKSIFPRATAPPASEGGSPFSC